MKEVLGSGVSGVLATVLPKRCLLCGEMQSRYGEKEVVEPSNLCGACFGRLFMFTEACCARCGVPFPIHTMQGTVCGACTKEPPSLEACCSIFAYDAHSKNLVVRLKNKRDFSVLPYLIFLLRRASKTWHNWPDIVLPVPLHWSRLWRRGFNQAALLAKAFDKKRYDPFVLKRLRRTASTRGQTRVQRKQNVRGVFAVPLQQRRKIQNKNVLLIDDVMTTGATLEEASRALLKAGAGSVKALTLARVVLPHTVF